MFTKVFIRSRFLTKNNPEQVYLLIHPSWPETLNLKVHVLLYRIFNLECIVGVVVFEGRNTKHFPPEE